MRLRRLALAVAACVCLLAADARPAAATHVSVQAVFNAPQGTIVPGMNMTTAGGTSWQLTGTLTGQFAVGASSDTATLNCSVFGTDFGTVPQGTGQFRGGCMGNGNVTGIGISINCDLTYQRAGAVTVSMGVCTVAVGSNVASGVQQGAYSVFIPPPYTSFTWQGPFAVGH